MKTYTVYLRELKVTPVIIEAETQQQAEIMALNGDGDAQASYPSALSLSDILDDLFEEETAVIN